MSRSDDIDRAFSKAVNIYYYDIPDKDMAFGEDDYNGKRIVSKFFYSLKYMFNSQNIDEAKFKRAIEQFQEKLSFEAPYINLDIFNKNLKTLGIFYNNYSFYNRLTKQGIRASYDSIENNLYITKDEVSRILYHELLHTATADINKETKEYKVGFRYANIKENIHLGRFFNEGYTEVVADRYFGMRAAPAYVPEKAFASMIEDVVGKEKMETCYFEANVLGLFRELEKYSSQEKMVQFFKDIEQMHHNSATGVYDPKEQSRLFGNCQQYCLECYLTKLKQKGMSHEEISMNYAKYLDTVYERVIPAFSDNLSLTEMISVSTHAYDNVIGLEKSNHRL